MKYKKKFVLIGYTGPLIKTYKVRYNNKKRIGFVAAWLVSLVIPFTTAPLTMLVGAITKYKPLYFLK